MTQPTLLFVCTTTPAATTSAGTIAGLAEIGVDHSELLPARFTEELVRSATAVISTKPGLDLPQVDGVTSETWAGLSG